MSQKSGKKKPIVKFATVYDKVKLPERKNENDAGYDCFVHHFRIYNPQTDTFTDLIKTKPEEKEVTEWELEPNGIIGCGLGFCTVLPQGYYAQLVPRSGNAIKFGLTVVNTPATIDTGYLGEWVAIIGNISKKPHIIKVGDKICQMILRKMEEFDIEVLKSKDELPSTSRGANGFGSSGK